MIFRWKCHYCSKGNFLISCCLPIKVYCTQVIYITTSIWNYVITKIEMLKIEIFVKKSIFLRWHWLAFIWIRPHYHIWQWKLALVEVKAYMLYMLQRSKYNSFIKLLTPYKPYKFPRANKNSYRVFHRRSSGTDATHEF